MNQRDEALVKAYEQGIEAGRRAAMHEPGPASASRSRWVTEGAACADVALNGSDLGPAPWAGRAGPPAPAVPEDVAWLLGHLLDAVEPVDVSILAAQADARGLKWDTVSRKARRRGLTSTRQLPGRAAQWVCELSGTGWTLASRARELA